jgi:spoIIIJ-associated protein
VGAESLARLGGLDLLVSASLAEEGVRIELGGADAEWLSAQAEEVHQAFEDLLRRMLRTPNGEAIPVSVDCRGRRGAREGELRSLALAAALAVRRTGRPVELDPLPPTERRVIHLALAGEVDLVTESRGAERDRRLEIRLRDPETAGEGQIR